MQHEMNTETTIAAVTATTLALPFFMSASAIFVEKLKKNNKEKNIKNEFDNST